MELLDWIDLLAGEPRLLDQGWSIWTANSYMPGFPQVYRIRNADGQCPLCAWAELQGSKAYQGSWLLAMREVFGMETDFGDAALIADGADIPLAHSRATYPEAFFARQLLLELFNLQEPV